MNKCLWLAGATVAAVLAVSLPIKSANADPITGQISLIGNDVVDFGANTIEFITGAKISAGTESGSFLTVLGSGDVPVTMDGEGTFINFSNLIGNVLFTTSGGTAAMTVASEAVTEIGNSLIISGTGTLTLAGFDPTMGSFSVTTQSTGGPAEVTFSATAGVPGPIVGAGLPGLVAACCGLLALARRRRGKIA